MAHDDQGTQADDPGASGAQEPGSGRRRRSPRPWSSPAPTAPPDDDRVDKPLSESAWGWKPEGGARGASPRRGARSGARTTIPPRPPAAPAPAVEPTPSPYAFTTTSDAPEQVDADAVLEALEALAEQVQSQLALLQVTVAEAAQRGDTTQVTGAELAATIESLGTSLGTGMASLLSDHRNLLARDLEAASDRILDELGQRLRTHANQTTEAMEERVRQLMAKGLTNLGDQLELRLDQLQADVTGLRAVMLEIPDQTVVTNRLDQLADVIGGRREQARLSPAMTAAVERAVSGPLGRFESAIAAVTEAVGDLELRFDADGPPAAALAPRPAREVEPVAKPAAPVKKAAAPKKPTKAATKTTKATKATKAAKRPTKASKATTSTGRRRRGSS